jgi:hypothetical protein
MQQAASKEPRFRAEGPGIARKPARFQREKEPPVISLATKYWYQKGNYGANLTRNLCRYKCLC